MIIWTDVRKVHHYLFGRAPGVSTASQTDETHLELNFPGSEPVIVPFDHRQRGVLVAFDGTLLWGSLPRRNGSLVHYESQLDLSVPVGQLRKPIDVEENPKYHIEFDDKERFAKITIYRSVVLMPFNYRMVVRKYDEKSLSPKYAIVATNDKSAVWLASS